MICVLTDIIICVLTGDAAIYTEQVLWLTRLASCLRVFAVVCGLFAGCLRGVYGLFTGCLRVVYRLSEL